MIISLVLPMEQKQERKEACLVKLMREASINSPQHLRKIITASKDLAMNLQEVSNQSSIKQGKIMRNRAPPIMAGQAINARVRLNQSMLYQWFPCQAIPQIYTPTFQIFMIL